MNGPRIQTDERGFTINKALGWSMLVTILGVVFLGGSTLANISTRLASQEAMRAEVADELRQLIDQQRVHFQVRMDAQEARLRPLENAAPAIDQRLSYIAEGIRRIEQQILRDGREP